MQWSRSLQEMSTLPWRILQIEQLYQLLWILLDLNFSIIKSIFPCSIFLYWNFEFAVCNFKLFWYSTDRYLYRGTVFTGPCSGQEGHAIAIVGYGTSTDGIDYWVCISILSIYSRQQRVLYNKLTMFDFGVYSLSEIAGILGGEILVM